MAYRVVSDRGKVFRIYEDERWIATMSVSRLSGKLGCDWHVADHWGTNVRDWIKAIQTLRPDLD